MLVSNLFGSGVVCPGVAVLVVIAAEADKVEDVAIPVLNYAVEEWLLLA